MKGNTGYNQVSQKTEKRPCTNVHACVCARVCMCVCVCVCVCVRRADPFQKLQGKRTGHKTHRKQNKKTSTQWRHNCISHNGFWVWEIRKYNDARGTQWPCKMLICVKIHLFFQCFCHHTAGETLGDRLCVAVICWAGRVHMKCNIAFNVFIGSRYCCTAAAAAAAAA